MSKSRSWLPVHRIAIAVAVAIALAIGCPVGFASFAESSIGVLDLDPAKTLVEFKVGGSLHPTRGKFKIKSGTIKADSVTGNAEGEIVVDATSGDSGDSLRDNRMKNVILEAEKYPFISFNPRHVDGHLNAQGNFRAKLEGVLTLHGTRHDVVIETKGKLNGKELIATGHLLIPYVEWGLKDPSVLFLSVSKEVDIDIATAGHVRWVFKEAASVPQR